MKLEYSFQYPLFLFKQLRELLRLKKKKRKIEIFKSFHDIPCRLM